MQFKTIEEELNILIGKEKTAETMAFIREDALKTTNLLDVYFKILPNRKIYFFKRFLGHDGKIVIVKLDIERELE